MPKYPHLYFRYASFHICHIIPSLKLHHISTIIPHSYSLFLP
jgi:hypothetical protein